MSVLDDLLARPDQKTILDNEVLPELVTNEVKVTDWIVGSLTRAAAYTIAKLRSLTMETIATMAATRFGDYVFGFLPLPNATAEEQADLLKWAPIVAKQSHGIDQILATRTTRTLTITNSTAQAYNQTAGRLTVQFVATGNRYVSAADYVSAGNDSVAVLFQSEFAVDSGAGLVYMDSDGDTIILVTAQFPGVAITASVLVAQGRDAETPQELGARWRAVYPLLNWSTDGDGNFIPPSSLTLSAIESLTRRAFAFVKVCSVRTDATVNDKIHVVIGQQGAAPTGPQVTAVQAFWNLYGGITDFVAVDAATTDAIALGSLTITVRAAQRAAAQVALQNRLAAYLGGVDQNRVLKPGGTIAHAYLVALIETTPGVLGVTDSIMTISGTGGSTTGDYALATGAIATWSQDVTSDFTWVNG